MKLCLVGSTRFKDIYVKINQELTLKGHIVYTVAFDTTTSQRIEVSEQDKEILDLVHLRKISESDGVVLITDGTGYFGDSTRRELIWAQINNKLIWTIEDAKSLGCVIAPKKLFEMEET